VDVWVGSGQPPPQEVSGYCGGAGSADGRRLMLRRVVIVSALVLAATAIQADERQEAERLAPKYKAKVEVRLEDDSRVDLLNDTYAIEVDWADKWAESIGQSVHYGLLTDRKPAVLLLVRDPSHEWKSLVRAARVCGHLGIRLYVEVLPTNSGDH